MKKWRVSIKKKYPGVLMVVKSEKKRYVRESVCIRGVTLKKRNILVNNPLARTKKEGP